MADQHEPTISKFHNRLAEVSVEIQRLRARIERSQAKLKELLDQQETLVEALQLVGEDVPEVDQETIARVGAARRPKRKMRAIDAALLVIKPGEELGKHEIAERVEARELPFKSEASLANALATAMNRSPQFKNLGRGIFKRLERTETVETDSTDRDSLFD